jgi:hypothetical protein
MTPIKDFAVSEQMNKLLIELNACEDARTWAADKSWKEIFDTCHRGDWLLWLFKKVNPNDLQKLTLAKGHCANTVRHLMKDERSTKAVDAAIAFGEGLITREELKAAYAAADYAAAAYAAADAYAAAADAYAAAAADADAYAAAAAADAYAAAADAYAAAADAYAAAAAAAAYAAARTKNQQATADICRKYLPIEIWNIQSK